MEYKFIDENFDTDYIRRLAEKAGFIFKQSRPEDVRCPMCGKRTIYTWRHWCREDIVMAVECSYCGLNCLTTAAPIGHLEELLKNMREHDERTK